jgi:hypothetical protein
MQVQYKRKTEVQRDMDLIRDLLLGIEADSRLDGTNWITPDEHEDTFGVIPAHSADEVAYHLVLLIEAGYVDGKTTMDMPIISRLTWQGHEFLDNIRDKNIWHATKERVKGLPGVALKIVAAIAEAEVKKRLGLT